MLRSLSRHFAAFRVAHDVRSFVLSTQASIILSRFLFRFASLATFASFTSHFVVDDEEVFVVVVVDFDVIIN